MAVEKTFVMIKPDGIQREIAGEIISRFERKGLKLVGMKMIKMSREKAETHYGEHKGKGFYDELIAFITSGPVILSVWEGLEAIKIVRKVVGATSPDKAEPGTIRGDFVLCTTFNVVHASDSGETAKKEISHFFEDNEIFDYSLPLGEFLQ
ncbi:MAG: nucleoside-diphosphate kinase [Candidatus Aminicenantes bacterium]|nr:nucleoside-diphosphate kinase [Candidatus Aminicenantes bacterium]